MRIAASKRIGHLFEASVLVRSSLPLSLLITPLSGCAIAPCAIQPAGLEQACNLNDLTCCDSNCVHPIDRLKARLQGLSIPVPTIPVPGCYYEWQAKRNLPEGPDGAVFHPLPTRPMFQSNPNRSNPTSMSLAFGNESGFGGCEYGRIPREEQWHENSLVPDSSGSNLTSPDSVAGKKPVDSVVIPSPQSAPPLPEASVPEQIPPPLGPRGSEG